ncbi:MAG: hypothetical protein CL419_11580 [Acidimicrobiaceae bacterium]|nr:hypothetical protein [Acidimicrobiaceae bacterium]
MPRIVVPDLLGLAVAVIAVDELAIVIEVGPKPHHSGLGRCAEFVVARTTTGLRVHGDGDNTEDQRPSQQRSCNPSTDRTHLRTLATREPTMQ